MRILLLRTKIIKIEVRAKLRGALNQDNYGIKITTYFLKLNQIIAINFAKITFDEN